MFNKIHTVHGYHTRHGNNQEVMGRNYEGKSSFQCVSLYDVASINYKLQFIQFSNIFLLIISTSTYSDYIKFAGDFPSVQTSCSHLSSTKHKLLQVKVLLFLKKWHHNHLRMIYLVAYWLSHLTTFHGCHAGITNGMKLVRKLLEKTAT
jgi:hypothetical protein